MNRRLNSNALVDMLVSGSGSMIAPVINFAAVPVVMRIYGPVEYGSWVLIMSLALILGNVATLRYELPLVLARDDREASLLIVLCVLLVSLTTGLGFLVVAAGPAWVDFFPPLRAVASSLWAFPVLTFFIGLSWVGRSFCTRQKAFVYNSASFIVFATVTNTVQIVAPGYGFTGSAGLLAGSILGWMTAVVVLLAGWWRHSPNRDIPRFEFSELLELVRKYRNFGRYSVPYTFIGTFRLEGAKLLLGSYGSPGLVGDFSFAQRLTNFPVTLFCGGIRPVLFQKAASTGDHSVLEPFIRRIMMVLVLASVPMAVLVEIKMDAIFGFFVGEKWVGAVPYARIMVLPALGMMLTGWMDRLFDVKGRQGLALLLQAVFTVLGLLGFLVGLVVLDDPIAAVLVQGLVTMGHFFFSAMVIYRIFGFPMGRMLWLTYIPLVLVVVVGGSWWLLEGVAGEWGALVLGVLVAYAAGFFMYRKTFPGPMDI
jgi:O-antigen/teichoic acid export membrane protein